MKKVLILAGGLGTRLRSIINDRPKVMAPIYGRPFLEWQIRYLNRFGLKNIILCVGYMKDVIKDYFGDGKKFDTHIEYSEEDKPLGTGGAIKNAREFIKKERRFFVVNGDTYANTNYWTLLYEHYTRQPIATLAVTRINDTSRYGVITLDAYDNILSFKEKESQEGEYINAGTYLFEKKIFSYMPDRADFSLEYDVIPKIVEVGKAYGWIFDGYFGDLGTPEDYKRIQNEFELKNQKTITKKKET